MDALKELEHYNFKFTCGCELPITLELIEIVKRGVEVCDKCKEYVGPEVKLIKSLTKILNELGFPIHNGYVYEDKEKIGITGDIDECSICFSEFTNPVIVCGEKHCFCNDCIDKWRTLGNETCPCCRKELLDRFELVMF